MKYFKYLFIILISSLNTIGQEISTEIPVLSPQTPTTSQLGKFGEIQVNESTGLISPSIPLFDYVTDKLTIPITLSYSGNAVKVNQDPTWVGVNWNLNPAGVITRQVKDEIDELTYTKKYDSRAKLESIPGSNTPLDRTTEWWNYLKNLSNSNVDNEVDIFNYNFLGYSGSFFLDENLNAHLIKYDKEVTIAFSKLADNKSEITITTPNGDRFYFGGPDASESSRTYVNIGAGSTVNSNYAQNAFYLHKISFLNGGHITFEYENFKATCDQYKIGVQESISKPSGLGSASAITKRDIYVQIQNAVVLKKIWSTITNQVVLFDVSNHGKCNRARKLNTIELITVNNSINVLLKKINLAYIATTNETETIENRYFLSNVSFFDNQNTFVNDYKLEYNNIGAVPQKNSNAQDELGYYNGKTTNQTLLPKDANVNFSFVNGLADRSADLGYSLYGSLMKITYPTKGTTSFEYELPFKGYKDVYASQFFSAYYKDPTRNGQSSFYEFKNNMHTYSKTIYPDEGDGPLILSSSKTINLRLLIDAMGSYSHQNNVLVSVIDLNRNKTVWTNGASPTSTVGFQITTTDNVLKNYVKDYSVTLGPGNYIFKLSINLLNFSPTSTTTNYVTSILQIDLPSVMPVYHAGPRIKFVKTINPDGKTADYKRYYYSTYNYSPVYYYITRGLNERNEWSDVYNLSTTSVKNPYNAETGNTYDTVTLSYGDDNYINGGKELKFAKMSDRSADYYTLTANYFHDPNVPIGTEYSFSNPEEYQNFIDVGYNNSFENSILLSEKFFDKSKKVLKIETYNYTSQITKTINNIKFYDFNPKINGKLIFLYDIYSRNHRLTSKVTEEHFGSNKIISTINYHYDIDKVSLPREIVTTNSKGETITQRNYYPSNASQIVDYDTTQINLLNQLQLNNNVSELIKTEKLVGNTTTQTVLKKFSDSSGRILPWKILVKKENTQNFEDYITYEQYGAYAKPTLITYQNNVKIRYSYNEYLQPFLKIENYTLTEFDDNLANNTPCYYQNLYPNSMVTKYDYDDLTHNLIKVTDPKCETVTYQYDTFGRLKQVIDHNGNILNENQYNYRAQ